MEETLSKLVSPASVVPTNTVDPWYTELKALSAPNIKASFQQSDDDRWISLALEYDCPQVAPPMLYANYRGYRVLTILTPPMLRASQVLRENTIFASEFVPYVSSAGEEHPPFSKRVNFYFSRATIAEVYQRIKEEMETLLSRISDETALIQEDNLARGEFVRAVFVPATRANDKPRWEVTTSSLQSPVSDSDPVEYWAGKPVFVEDFLTNTESFPWMPVDISSMTIPF